jgi:hypothetical protein
VSERAQTNQTPLQQRPCDAGSDYKQVEAIDLDHQGGSGEPPLPKSIDQKKAPGGFHLLGAYSIN